jgi:hypothetical protein
VIENSTIGSPLPRFSADSQLSWGRQLCVG